jgi:osmotically-inducible protein OsmY
MRPDPELKRDLEIELRSDPKVGSNDIAVTVKDGVALLAGFVRSHRTKRAAEAAAKRVAGVVAIANDIEVRLPFLHQRPDPAIATDVVEALRQDLPDAAREIQVTVKGGWVTLEGVVDWHYEREEAKWTAYRQRGVVGVSNLILLRRAAIPAEVLRDIIEAFKRNAGIDANRITVELAGSEVLLRGIAGSWAERDEAERVVWSFPGITRVDNGIVVQSEMS